MEGLVAFSQDFLASTLGDCGMTGAGLLRDEFAMSLRDGD